jgi:hypothetical protein
MGNSGSDETNGMDVRRYVMRSEDAKPGEKEETRTSAGDRAADPVTESRQEQDTRGRDALPGTPPPNIRKRNKGQDRKIKEQGVCVCVCYLEHHRGAEAHGRRDEEDDDDAHHVGYAQRDAHALGLLLEGQAHHVPVGHLVVGGGW